MVRSRVSFEVLKADQHHWVIESPDFDADIDFVEREVNFGEIRKMVTLPAHEYERAGPTFRGTAPSFSVRVAAVNLRSPLLDPQQRYFSPRTSPMRLLQVAETSSGSQGVNERLQFVAA